MRILHLSDSSLPDWRVEKSAYSSKKRGDEVYFGGNNPFNHKSIFNKVYNVNWSTRARNKFPFYWNSVKKQVIDVIKEVKPDIIHAHNIFSAAIVKEIDDYPLVYDNHEYWTMYTKTQLETFESHKRRGNDEFKHLSQNLFRKQINNRFARIWSKAEKELVEEQPTITVSNSIVEDLLKIGKKIYLVPNFPTIKEVESIPEPIYHESTSSVYAGVESKGQFTVSHRNIDGLFSIFENSNIGQLFVLGWSDNSSKKVIFRGYLNKEQMYQEMQNHSIGLIPFRKHWFHQYSSPNKAYEYAHAGLFVLNTLGLKSITETLQEHCMQFENYSDLVAKLGELFEDLNKLHKKRLKVYKFARNHLLWEHFERNIFDSYKIC
ncbi:MAG: hypothetical protein DA329_12005 [Candidatus Nitrosocosmicus sp.]|jgi:hypothetical protein|nr:hypothetical protein [Candidatus Nitrosocosmicus sp.]